MKIKITLLSDICVSDGDGYNSLVDTEVVSDDFGLPFIPAKRLKGCMREAALELVDFGVLEEKKYKEIFGEAGNSRAKIGFTNARQEHYEDYLADIRKAKAEGKIPWDCEQRILSEFSYIRTETAVDPSTGTADETSLRTIRLVNRGNSFIADLFGERPEEWEEQLRLICNNTMHMGVARTRGLGEVCLELIAGTKNETGMSFANANIGTDVGPDELCRLDYVFRTKSPVLFKSVYGGQEKTQVYIEGSRILGVLAETLGQTQFRELILNDPRVRCSFAYISDEKCVGGSGRFEPAAASLNVKKNQEEGKDGRLRIRDRSADCEARRQDRDQISSLGTVFISADGRYRKVRTQVDYHHSRPEDKSFGRADAANPNSSFFQISSISENQCFSGFIEGPRRTLETIAKALSVKPHLSIGYGRSSEYGQAELIDLNMFPIKTDDTSPESTEFLVRLVSPVILYNSSGMYSVEMEDLSAALSKAFSTAVKVEADRFLKYTMLGGFNVTWQREKPMIYALDKGTVLRCSGNDAISLSKENTFIGERTKEGFGEVRILPIPKEYEAELKRADDDSRKVPAEYRTDLLESLLRRSEKKTIRYEGRSAAGNLEISADDSAVVGKLLLLLDAFSEDEKLDYDKLCGENGVDGISKTATKKKKRAKEIVDMWTRKKTEYISDKEAAYAFMSGLLNELKYRVRALRVKNAHKTETDTTGEEA